MQSKDMYIKLDDWPIYTAEFRTWVERRFSPEVLAAFTKDAEPDWLTWLDHEQAAVDGRFQDSVTLFEEAIRATYLGIRVIHASRLPSIDPVVQHGLRAWSAADLRVQAHDLFRQRGQVHFSRM